MPYRSESKSVQAAILDELYKATGRHRNHARTALRRALVPMLVKNPRRPHPPVYGELRIRGRWGSKPRSLLKAQIPSRHVL